MGAYRDYGEEDEASRRRVLLAFVGVYEGIDG